MAVDEKRLAPGLEESKRPASVAAGPYGHPFHPLFVTVPIGAWIGSFILDVGSQVVEGGAALARGAWWMIALGVLGALAAAVFGLVDLLRLPRRTPVFRRGLVHMALNLGVTAAFVASFLWRWDRGLDQETSAGQIILSGAALAALAVSGWIGGQLSYRFGVRVVHERDQLDGYRTDRPGAR